MFIMDYHSASFCGVAVWVDLTVQVYLSSNQAGSASKVSNLLCFQLLRSKSDRCFQTFKGRIVFMRIVRFGSSVPSDEPSL